MIVYEHWNSYGLHTTTEGDSQPNRGHIPRLDISRAYRDVLLMLTILQIIISDTQSVVVEARVSVTDVNYLTNYYQWHWL